MALKQEQRISGGFILNDLLPKHGNPVPESTPDSLAQMRKRSELVRQIYIHNPNHTPVFKALDAVISLGVKGVYQTGVRNAAESYAGKSSAADEFARIVAARQTYPANSRPVVRVELEQACTAARFWAAINSAYGDDFAGIKNEDKGRRSAYQHFDQFGTVLLILDEIQHAGYRSKGSSAPTDVIKRFISDGQVGIGLFGNEAAIPLLESNNQLSHRLQEPCDIQPLDLSQQSEQRHFTKFIRAYDKALVAKGLFAESADLHDPRTAMCLMAISRGYFGRLVTLLRVAGKHAYLRNSDRIELFDLAAATRTWAVAQGLIGYNPFTYGQTTNV